MIRRIPQWIVIILVAALFMGAPDGWAQDLSLAYPDHDVDVSYSEEIPGPQEVMGHQIGTQHTRPAQVVDYYRAIEASSDRVQIEQHARSYEGRPLIHAVVSAPENLARLDEIRANNRRLVEQPDQVSDEEIQEMPGVIYIGYSIHGDEASGTEAALLTLHHLAAGQDQSVSEVLDNLVVILDPMLNPDGRDRFVDWVNGNRGRVATKDLEDREHNQAWPGGRTNHYMFDLNRDWMPTQHPESRGRIELFYDWRPQLVVDVHEMGRNATYFFQPGVPSRTHPRTPEDNQALTEEFATFHAAAFDEKGSLYYSKESYDDYYYGKGSTFPDINGSIGILFEQASSRSLKTETNIGTLTYAETIHNQFTSSLSTLEGAVQLREQFMRHQRDFYSGIDEWAAEQPVQGYVFASDRHRTRAAGLVNLLQRHEIRVHELARDVEADGRTYPAGESYYVPLDQPQGRMLAAMMERRTTFPDSIFYDVSAWTMSLAFGVETARLPEADNSLAGPEVRSQSFPEGEIFGGEARYAYLMEWDSYYAPRAVYRALDLGMHPRVATKPFTLEVEGESRSFDRGTIVLPVARRDADSDVTEADVHEVVQEMAAEDYVRLHAVNTGFTPTGIDLGSPSAEPLEKPTVAVIAGDGTSSNQVGEIWHLMNERMGMPVSLLNLDDAGDADLSRYNTIVMAASYGHSAAFGRELHSWVEDGGLLITIDNASEWVVQQEFVDEEIRETYDDTTQVRYADLSRKRGAQEIGGSIFEATLDPTHPVAYGFGETVALFKNNRIFMEPSNAQAATVAAYTEDPVLSGYISDENLERLRGAGAIIARNVGGGQIVMFTDDPNFRAFWWGTQRLFLNAVFLGQVL
jgi:hypothetical protein